MGFFGKMMGGKRSETREEHPLCQSQCCSGVSMRAEGERAAKSWTEKSFFGERWLLGIFPNSVNSVQERFRSWAEREALKERRDHLQIFNPSASYSVRAPSLLTNVSLSLIAVHISSLSKGSLWPGTIGRQSKEATVEA